MFKDKFLIFIILMIALLSISVASADESSINATVDDSSTEVLTSTYDENTSLDVESKDNIETSQDVKYSNDTAFSNNDLISSSESTTQKDMLASGEITPKTFTQLNEAIGEAKGTLILDSNYTMTDGDASFSNGIVISQNLAIDGKGFTIDANNSGRIFKINSGVTVSLTNVTLANGKTTDDGGAIFNLGTVTLILTNVTFVNNSAQFGGAINIDNEASDFTVSNCSFVNNSATEYGGAIYNGGSGFKVSNCSFVNNSAERYGGAIDNEAPDFTVSNSVFVNNTAANDNAIYSFSSCSANDNWWGNNTPNWEKLVNNKVTHDTYAVLSLTATSNSVAINFYQSGTEKVLKIPTRSLNLTIGDEEDLTNITDGTFAKEYSAPTTEYNVTAGVDNQKLVISFLNNVYVDPEGSDENTGADWNNPVKTIQHAMEIVLPNGKIYLSDGTHEVTSQITIDKTVTIIGNGTKTFITNNKRGNVVFWVNDDNVTIYNSTFVNIMTGFCKGAIYLGSGVNFTISNCSFVNNSASSNGGVIYNEVGVSSFTISNCSFINNTGASINNFCNGVSSFTVSGCSFINNTAENAGAICNIYDNGEGFTVMDCSFINNTGRNGGAIWNGGCNFVVSNCSFINNTADKGGAIFNQIPGTSCVTVSDCSFINNTANEGGAIWNYCFNFTVSNSKFKDNNASKGTAIYISAYVDDEYSPNFSTINLNNNTYDGISEGKTYIYNDGTILTPVTITVLGNKTINTKKGESVVLFANITTADGASVDGGVLNFTIGSEEIQATSNDNGTYEYNNYEIIENAYKIVSAYYEGGRNVSVLTAILDSRKSSSIDFSTNNAEYGKDLIIKGNITEGAAGSVTIILDDDKTYTANITDAKFNCTITDLISAGDHKIAVKYDGNNMYNSTEVNKAINIAPTAANLEVSIANVTYGEILNITATLTGVNNTSLNGIIKVEIDGKTYEVEIKEGICTYEDITLPAGEYEFTATWQGNTNYTKANFGDKFNISKSNSTIKVGADNVKVGENTTITVTLSKNTTGNVTITIDGKNYTAYVENDIATKNITINKSGNHTAYVVYNGDNNYNTIKGSANFTVYKISNYNITINVENIAVGQNATIKVTLPTDINENITIAINNENYTAIAKNGIATINITDLASGEYTVVVNFENDKYAYKSANTTFDVSKISDYSINITSDVINANENTTITVNLPKDADGNVTITIADNNYTGIAKNGTADITIPELAAGEYNATITYIGNDKYTQKEINKTISVIEYGGDVNLIADDVVMIYKDGSRLYATLLNFLGNPIANATVFFTINGITYNRATDKNGSASIALNLVAGNYVATITYNTTTVNANVTIKSSIIAKNIVKMYQNDTQFYATFLGTGGKALANTNVTFNINGVFYTRTTNENGIAKLTINLNPGNYTLTAINPVNGEQQGFNVLVKSLIKSNDLTKYYKNASKFEAKIYNKDGSLAINKVITLNINGVLYKRTTDENGIVKLVINLNPGNYIITTMYDGLSIGNNIKVLPTLITSDLSMSYNDGSKFSVKTLDGQGKSLANQNVVFNVNGVFYNKVSDENGIANLNINLFSGEYIITSMWNDYQVGNKITIS